MNKKDIFIGYFDFDKNEELIFNKQISVKIISNSFNEEILEIEPILNKNEVELLIKLQKENETIPVGIDGIAKNYIKGSKIHSYRSTFYSELIANSLFERIKDKIKPMKSPYDGTNDFFEACGINPAFRFIDYTKNGYLVPHYDFPYKKDDDCLSLMSLVIYLKDNINGKTRYIKEYRENNFTDWNRKPLKEEILFEIIPKAGNALLFPHNILHDSEEVSSNKIIVRTDILFKRINN